MNNLARGVLRAVQRVFPNRCPVLGIPECVHLLPAHLPMAEKARFILIAHTVD